MVATWVPAACGGDGKREMTCGVPVGCPEGGGLVHTWQLNVFVSAWYAGAHQSQRGCLLKAQLFTRVYGAGATPSSGVWLRVGDSRPSTVARVHLCSSKCKPGGRCGGGCVCVYPFETPPCFPAPNFSSLPGHLRNTGEQGAGRKECCKPHSQPWQTALFRVSGSSAVFL